MVYDNEVKFSVTCKNHVPVISSASLEWVGKGVHNSNGERGRKGPKHPVEVSEGLFKLAEGEFLSLRKTTTSLSSVSLVCPCSLLLLTALPERGGW